MEDAFTGAEFGDLHQNLRVYLVLTTGIIGKAAWEDTAFHNMVLAVADSAQSNMKRSGCCIQVRSATWQASLCLIMNGLPCQQHITPYAIHCVHRQDLRHTYMIAYSFSRSITSS